MLHFALVFIPFFAFCSVIYGQTGWVRHSDPVLDVGNPGEWDDELVGLPDIIFDGNSYHMWYSGYDGTYGRIGYATSPDGITWDKHQQNPVLDIGDPGTWDDYAVIHSPVVLVDTVYHMWYNGNDGLGNQLIGHATSFDGVNWDKDTSNPVLDLGPPGSWDDSYVQVIGFVSFESDTFHMWYDGYDGTYFRIGYATATNPNGRNWTKYANNPVLDVGAPGSWDNPRVHCRSIVFSEDIFYMFYSGGDYFTWQIGFATAPDRVNWSKNPSNPDFTVGQPGSWDDYYVSFPYVLSTTSELKMWYMGGTGVWEGKVGYATASITSIEEDHQLLTEFGLEQNYPNPFNPTTSIKYQNPELSFVILKVYDVLGSEITSLINEEKLAGEYEIEFNATGLPSGIYFYRLQALHTGRQAGSFVETKKMLLLK